jgi:thioredoxin-like negative regulator of GroEL
VASSLATAPFASRTMHAPAVEVLVVTTPWCHHCKAMQPELQRLSELHRSTMRVEQIDAAVDPDRAGELGVMATPTVIMRVDGAERSRLIGRVSNHDLEQFFASAGTHRPFPTDGITRVAAAVALLAFGWAMENMVLAGVGVLLGVWAAVTMWRWAR